jgi:hypothetical protein
LFWLDVEAYRLQRRLAKGGAVNMTRMNDFEVKKKEKRKNVGLICLLAGVQHHL